MRTEFTDKYISDPKNAEFLKAVMMGPNAMRVTEELASHLNIENSMRILDIGCGCGLSAILLSLKFGATIFATDLWISPSENYERFKSLKLDDKIVPLHVDATKGMPFANGYFDLLISVDAYHYFGDTLEMLPSLKAFVKKGGHIAIAIPGLKSEFGENVPNEMKPFWNSEMERSIHSLQWWKNLWSQTRGLEIINIKEMDCCRQAWEEWLTAYHPVVADDVKMMAAENGNYFNLIQLIAKVL